MNRHKRSRRRFRVVARPVDRARRAKTGAAVLAVALLGAVAVASARHAASAWARVRQALPVASVAESARVDGVPEPFLSMAQAAVDRVSGSAGAKAAALRERFPCVADVSVRRAWGEKSATLVPVMRRAVAAALRHGKPAGYLGEDGSVFSAPDGVFSFSGPSVEVASAAPDQLKSLAKEWPQLAAPGAFPSPLTHLEYRSEDEGWQARLEDGTVVLWGRFDWTKEKLTRLAEALSDARVKAPGAFAADLRFFEDGKVLLKPIGPALAGGVSGGMR